MINVAILGASGYTGAELIRLLLGHDDVRISYLTANNNAGVDIGTIYPQFNNFDLPILVTNDEVDYSNIDLVFCCLPHGTTQAIIKSLPDHVKIIDLSADFRINNPETYKANYGKEHIAIQLQKNAVYGLSEHNRQRIKQARLIANPGCYPTSILMPLLPLIGADIIEEDNITCDCKSGISGAGRSGRVGISFCETSEGMSAYNISSHRHIAEMEQELNLLSKTGEIQIQFTPHLIPMRRGMISSIYLKCIDGDNHESVFELLSNYYDQESFINISQEIIPTTHHVRATNNCNIGVFAGRRAGEVVIISAIDNLVKGASGAAMQNMNIMFGFDENKGLKSSAIFP